MTDIHIVDSRSASLSARRVDNAWLVVQGGSGTTRRLQALTALHNNKLSLSAHTP